MVTARSAGALIGGGLAVAAAGARGVPPALAREASPRRNEDRPRHRSRLAQAGMAVAVAVVVLAATGWPVAAVLAAGAAAGLPTLSGGRRRRLTSAPSSRPSRRGPRCCGTPSPRDGASRRPWRSRLRWHRRRCGRRRSPSGPGVCGARSRRPCGRSPTRWATHGRSRRRHPHPGRHQGSARACRPPRRAGPHHPATGGAPTRRRKRAGRVCGPPPDPSPA